MSVGLPPWLRTILPQPFRKYSRRLGNRLQRELREIQSQRSSWPDELKKVEDFKMLPVSKIARASSIAELRKIAQDHPIHGFNGQIVRMACCHWMYKELGCTSFLETGTRWGYTAITARQLFGGPVYSVELKRKNYWHARRLARLALGTLEGLFLQRADSRDTLREWLASDRIGDLPMIYLDAHFYEDHPLVTELDLAITRGNCVIVIDDFKVPHDLGFGWDDKKGFEVAIESITSVLPKDRIQVFYPNYSASDETGGSRGMCILLIDQRLHSDTLALFPGTLLRESFDLGGDKQIRKNDR